MVGIHLRNLSIKLPKIPTLYICVYAYNYVYIKYYLSDLDTYAPAAVATTTAAADTCHEQNHSIIYVNFMRTFIGVFKHR